MMTSQILQFVDFTKTKKSKYLENETFFSKKKKSLITHQVLLYGKNTFLVEVTFKEHFRWHLLDRKPSLEFYSLNMITNFSEIFSDIVEKVYCSGILYFSPYKNMMYLGYL